MRVRWRALGALLTILTAGSAWAEDELPRLGVVALPAAGSDEAGRARLEEELLSGALSHSGTGFGWRLLAFSTAPRSADETAELKELGRLVEAGKKAYRYLKLEEAQKLFETAAGLLGRRPLQGCQAPEAAQLYLYWARAVLDSGDEAGAQALLSQVPRFDPKALPDPALMPPNLVATFDLALDERRGRSRGQVLLQAGPARASLRLDCQAQPGGVVQWNGVSGEALWLTAEVEGGILRLRLTVPDGGRRELTVWSGQPGEGAALRAQVSALAKAPSPLAGAGPASAALDRVASLTGVRLLLLGEPVQGGGLRLGLYAPGRGRLGEALEVPAGANGKVDPDGLGVALAELASKARATGTQVAQPGPVVAAAPAGEPPASDGTAEGSGAPPAALPPKDRRAAEDEQPAPPWYETWWFWTAAGGVVAAGLVTGLVLGLGGSSEPSGDVVISIGH
ncbi:MAG TPA: hypothetical protein PK668_21770 [Myxococcota bacterium]|nr:hypothetical protein [Myxococcota bacterium]HRY96397.1 hypothetical protein [Myxococcota bacterium]HSA20837.1 hypothetical protein [Myxococcota bacterium]